MKPTPETASTASPQTDVDSSGLVDAGDVNMTYRVQHNIGRAKYVVSFHDGIKTHPDGSPFFDVEIFGSKRRCQKFVTSLLKAGYVEASTVELSRRAQNEKDES